MWRFITMLLLAAVTLTTGVLLPRLPPLKLDPDQTADQTPDQTNTDTHSRPTECESLRRLFNSEANWMFDTDNTQYNDYNVAKRQADLPHDFDDERYSYQLQPQDLELKYPKHNPKIDEPRQYGMPLPTINTLYLRNTDVLIQHHQGYYVYDTYMTTTSPFDYVQNQHNCLYKAMSKPSSSNTLTDADILKWHTEEDNLNTNEMSSIEKMDKRFDTEDIGEKEIPDLMVSDGDTAEVQKKLFSFWSRLQALSHKGRQLPTRRHTFAFYGPDGTRDGPLTAETRASHLRPPGQPLRWG